ncbi:MAG: LysM peptidoglycan-binding domain-containing protein [Anaerolineaceae bacterium]|nr:LysM peptidoglycan-binding domain-containing protein [Anaerolineaceae bacterium]
MAINKKGIFSLSIVILLMGLLVGKAWASAPLPQNTFATPTPGESGEIRYLVQEGENCLAITLKLQMDLNELRSLNGLDENCTLQAGQELLVGFGATQTPVPVISPTPDMAGPTPTPDVSQGIICAFLFNDINGDGVPGDLEYPIADGVVSINDKENRISVTKNTAWDEPATCFEELPVGEYNISVAVPQGYNATSSTSYALVLGPGNTSKINFGAQESSEAPIDPNNGTDGPGENNGNILLGVFGIVLVLAGIGLGFYFWLLKK